MPQNITDANTFTSPIVAPADGDSENASSVLTGLQGLANRTNFINLLRGAASGIATLNGSSLITPAQLPYGIANGIAQADGTGRTPAASVRNGVIAVSSANRATTFTAASGTPTDIGVSVSLTTQVNDILVCLMSVQISGDAFAQIVENDNGGAFGIVGNANVGSGAAGGFNAATFGTIAVAVAGTSIVKCQGYNNGTSATIANTYLTVIQFRP